MQPDNALPQIQPKINALMTIESIELLCGHDVVVKAATWKVWARGFVTRLGIQFLKKQMFLLRSLCKIQYCGEPL